MFLGEKATVTVPHQICTIRLNGWGAFAHVLGSLGPMD